MKKINIRLALIFIVMLFSFMFFGCNIIDGIKKNMELDKISDDVINNVFVSNCDIQDEDKECFCTIKSSLTYIYSYKEVIFKYDSSHKDILDDSGKLNRPLNDTIVQVYVTYYFETDPTNSFEARVSVYVLGTQNDYAKLLEDLKIPSTISSDIKLPDLEEGVFDGILVYSSSNPQVLSSTGKVSMIKEDTYVTLTAKLISNNIEVCKRNFQILVKANYVKATVDEVLDYACYLIDTIDFKKEESNKVNIIKTSYVSFTLNFDKYEIPVTFSLKDESNLGGDYFINRTEVTKTYDIIATVTYENITRTKELIVIVEAIKYDLNTLCQRAINSIEIPQYVYGDLTLDNIITYTYDSKVYAFDVTWTSDSKYITESGKVTLDDSVHVVNLTCSSMGYSKTFTVNVMLPERSDLEVLELVSQKMQPKENQGFSFKPTTIEYEYNLKVYNIAISLVSHDQSIITNDGVIVGETIDDRYVDVTITYTYNDLSVSHTYNVLIDGYRLSDDEVLAKAKELLVIPSETSSNITLPKVIEIPHRNTVYEVNVTYTFDKPQLNEEGIVNRSYCDEIVNVKALLSFNYSNVTFECNVKVLKDEAKTIKAIESILNTITIDKEVYTSIELLNENQTYPNISMVWASSNESLISSVGEFNSPSSNTNVELTLTLSLDGTILETKVFSTVAMQTVFDILASSMDFEGMTTQSRYQTLTLESFEFNNVRIEEETINDNINTYLRCRNQDASNFNFTLSNIYSLKRVDFNIWKISGKSNIELACEKMMGLNQSALNSISLTNQLQTNQKIEASINVNSIGESILKVNGKTSGDYQFGIDNINVYRDLAPQDMYRFLSEEIPTSTLTSINLPLTTCYGGSISYVSSNPELLSNTGEVLYTPQSNQTVTLVCTINHIGKTYVREIEITILNSIDAFPLEIFFMDIGKYGQADCGESIYIRYKDIDILIDAADSMSASEKAVKEGIDLYLRDDTLDYVIATHPDADHIGGMPNVFENYNIANLIVFDGDHTSQKYRDFVEAYNNEGCNVYNIYDDLVQSNNLQISLAPQITINFLNTGYYNADTSKETNGRSIVFVLNAFGTKVLFTGDADNGSGHTNLEANYQNACGDIDILKVVHHGTKEGTSASFLRAVDPEVAIICNGNYLGNKHSHPHVETIEALYSYDSNMKVYAITGGGGADECGITSTGGYECSSTSYMQNRNGTIHVTITSSGYTIESEYYGATPIEIKDTIWYQGYLQTVN